MIVRKKFFTEDYARGFADGVEHVNDGAISDIQVEHVKDGVIDLWIVSFEDEGEKEGDEG